MKKKAFTLVELIIVIVIFVILATISFISISGYAATTRDVKRQSDIRELYKKIVLEQEKGLDLNSLVVNPQTGQAMIGGRLQNVKIGTINLEALRESELSFKPPKEGEEYLMAVSNSSYIDTITRQDKGYDFVQLLAKKEQGEGYFIVGNYHKIDEKDDEDLFATIQVGNNGGGDFTTTWRVATLGYGDENDTVEFGVVGGGSEDIIVDWGDGNVEHKPKNTTLLTHKYAGAKDYKIKIQNITRFANYSANNSSFGKLIAVNDWSNIQWTTTNSMFTYADHLNSIPSSAPNLSKVKSMWAMFQNATIFNQPLSNWDTSGVTLMGNMFGSDFVAAASGGLITTFNNGCAPGITTCPLNSWKTGKVTSMLSMFKGAAAFNQDISSWDVSNVTDMGRMFADAYAFNQPLNSWTMDNVTIIHSMFFGASSFNQPLNLWKTGNVELMDQMFSFALAFNQDIGDWDTSNVTDMRRMFQGAPLFNKNIGGWNTGKVTSMRNMFNGASAFNQDISSWDVSNVANSGGIMGMDVMFQNATSFNQDISQWCVSKIPSKPAYFDTNAHAEFKGNVLKQPKWGQVCAP